MSEATRWSPVMFRLSSIGCLIVGLSLLTGKAFGQAPHWLHEVWSDTTADRYVSIDDPEFRRGPFFGAWGEAVPVDPNAEPEPIATDRPDFTESSTTVGAGVAQIETGYTYTRNSTTHTHGHSWGEGLLRVGIYADWLELRAAVAPVTEVSNLGGMHNSVSGVEDLYLGVKLGLTAQSEWLPEVALVPQMTVPTGHAGFTADRTLPGCNLLYGWDVTESLSTAGSTQVNLAVDGDEAYVEWAQSWTVGLALAEDVGFYTEWFAIVPEQSSAVPAEHYLNSGFTWQPNDDVQWDIRAGTGLNAAAADFFCGVGLSLRFR